LLTDVEVLAPARPARLIRRAARNPQHDAERRQDRTGSRARHTTLPGFSLCHLGIPR
jgi:hypothetical protein